MVLDTTLPEAENQFALFAAPRNRDPWQDLGPHSEAHDAENWSISLPIDTPKLSHIDWIRDDGRWTLARGVWGSVAESAGELLSPPTCPARRARNPALIDMLQKHNICINKLPITLVLQLALLLTHHNNYLII